jgi:hypothetical protein
VSPVNFEAHFLENAFSTFNRNVLDGSEPTFLPVWILILYAVNVRVLVQTGKIVGSEINIFLYLFHVVALSNFRM